MISFGWPSTFIRRLLHGDNRNHEDCTFCGGEGTGPSAWETAFVLWWGEDAHVPLKETEVMSLRVDLVIANTEEALADVQDHHIQDP